ncbi:microtubule-associated protein RP/EB family member 1-like [Zootermopsis nevadensis]|uniref:microtubule-associated protein RP/EB family member 1-like n=1 Tax=Zootermopsis nevadensis TaxID=136037 RepID=UPI000B8E4B03|nr:microtubule-associated protein RP/EB family member 1-like [Zootermopsis nevadensis]
MNLFSPDKGKSRASEAINPASSSAASRFMTWTPKLLRKASFRRTSPPSRPAQPLSQLLLRSTNSRSSLPPSSRSTSDSNCSRSSPAPNYSRHTFAPSRATSPPGRPVPPNARTMLSLNRPLSPPSITPMVTPSTENSPNNIDTGSRQMTPVPAIRKAFFPVSPSEKTAYEQPSEDETKYTQQGAKPKKKRRAPAPPIPFPGKSTSDRQVNSNESDASMTSSVTSSSAEDPPPQERTAAATSDLEVMAPKPEYGPRNTELYEPQIKIPEPAGIQILCSQKRLLEQKPENGVKEIVPKNTYKGTQELEHDHVNGLDESGDGKEVVTKDDETTTKENEAVKHIELDDYPSYKSKSGTQKLQRTSENEMQENPNQTEDGKLSRQQDWHIHDVKHSLRNAITEQRKQLENGVQDAEISNLPAEKTCTLRNGKNCSTENVGLQNGEKMNAENIKQPKQLTPEPKPRTILPYNRELKETIC